MPFVSALPQDLRRPAPSSASCATSGAAALQYGSGQGMPRAARADPRGHGARGHPGQRRRRRRHHRLAARARAVTKLFLDPGDVVICRGPELRHRARRVPVVPGRGRPRRDGRARPDPRGAARAHRARCKAAGQARSSSSTRSRPSSNPAGVTLSWERRLEILEIARDERHPRARGQPVRPALLRRAAAAGDALGRGGRRRLPRHLLEDARARLPRRLGPRPARHPREARPGERGRGALAELVHASSSSPSTSRSADWRGQIDTFRGVYRERRDAMLSALARAPARAQLDRARTAASTSG